MRSFYSQSISNKRVLQISIRAYSFAVEDEAADIQAILRGSCRHSRHDRSCEGVKSGSLQGRSVGRSFSCLTSLSIIICSRFSCERKLTPGFNMWVCDSRPGSLLRIGKEARYRESGRFLPFVWTHLRTMLFTTWSAIWFPAIFPELTGLYTSP